MNKTLKKIIALVLAMLMLMPVAVIASAEGTTDAPVEEKHEHMKFYEIFAQFWVEVYEFFKYIFYDVFRGVPAL